MVAESKKYLTYGKYWEYAIEILTYGTMNIREMQKMYFRTLSCASQIWPYYFITPDELVQNKLPTNEPEVLISDTDVNTTYYDASALYRSIAFNGKLNSGEVMKVAEAENDKAN